jgi:hypothetical protein
VGWRGDDDGAPQERRRAKHCIVGKRSAADLELDVSSSWRLAAHHQVDQLGPDLAERRT